VWLMVVMTCSARPRPSPADSTSRSPGSSRGSRRRRWPACRRWGVVASMLMFALLAGLGPRGLAVGRLPFHVTTPAMGLPQLALHVWLPVLSLLVLWRLLQVFFRVRSAGR